MTRTRPTVPNYFAGPADESRSVVHHGVRVQSALAHSSAPFRDMPNASGEGEDHPDHEPGRNPITFPFHPEPDAVLQSEVSILTLPVTLTNFLGQGQTLGGCIIPLPDGGTQSPECTTDGVPPDTVGAVGPNHYVQAINSGIAIWNKSGTLAQAPKYTNTLWTGHPTTDGNRCSSPGKPAPGGNWGDAVVLYDQMADRWVITQFDITNGVNNSVGPSFQCVAVSKTGDPTGAYWTYDFKYTNAINDYGKFSVWPDAYYASFNMFDGGFSNSELCAYDRVKMQTGATATQQCFTSNDFGFLPSNADGQVRPPIGEPAFFVSLGTNGDGLDLYKFHVDWTTPASSTFTGPTSLPVATYNQLCGGSSCVPEKSPGQTVGSLGDRPMFRLVYRNFGTHEALFASHSVSTTSTGGIRWYEIRSPNATPSVFQQGTYAPADGKWRWMGSIAEDQAEGVALGFSISSTTTDPGIAWTGRLAGDTGGTMGQGEAVIQAGAGAETGTASDGTEPQRWGDYSSMTMDPTDDCTFWYTQEVYPSNGIFNFDTRISSMKFPNCAANDFTIELAPTTDSLQQGKTLTYTVTTTKGAGTAEAVVLSIQDLPSGVTSAFAPASVTAGTTSTLTLTATASAPITASPTPTFTVIGKAPSAVHPAMAEVAVIAPLANCGNGTVNSGEQCDDGASNGAATDCCTAACQFRPSNFACSDGNACTMGDTCQAGACTGTATACTALDECHGVGACDAVSGTCSNPPLSDGTACSVGACQSGACSPSAQPDAGPIAGNEDGGPGIGGDSGVLITQDSGAGGAGASGTSGNSSGCGCRTVAADRTPPWALGGFGGLAVGALFLRRVRRRQRGAAPVRP